MKYAVLLTPFFLLGLSSSSAASPNNGYTTAANVYSGSSSRGWFGGGTAYVIAQWKTEREARAASQPSQSNETAPENSEAPVSTPAPEE